MVAFLLGGCSRGPKLLPIEEKLNRARVALAEDRVFEARKWATEILAEEPKHLEGEKLMAKVIEQETLRERSLAGVRIPEEMTAEEKRLAIKTWLERSQGFLYVNQFAESLHAAEQVFLLDPQNLEASRLVDEIQRKAREQGKEESLFVRSLYQEEVQRRVQRYRQEAEAALEKHHYSAARLAVEKLLLLDPNDREGEKLLKAIEKADQFR